MSEYKSDDFDYQIAAEPEAATQINRELNLARRIVEETGANLFLTGKAGTGKTTFLQHLRRESRKRMVVLAPTGVAAINAGGMTLHSFFQLPFSIYIPGKGYVGEEKKYFKFSKEKRRLIASLDLMVIDEVSMVRPDTLDAIDALLRRLRNSDRPFGGIQLLLIGDLRQLAPVVRPSEWNLLRQFYKSEYFFESESLRNAGFVTVELLTIYRQQDPEFISLLNAVRDGRADQSVLNRLNTLCHPAQGDESSAIRLTTHNRTADEINALRMAMLPTPAATFKASVAGKFPESSYPADEFLTLKEGARVMFIKNDTGSDRRFYNGLIGTVHSISEEDGVTVIPDDPDFSPIAVEAATWENLGYSIDPETKAVKQTVEGTFSQLPLRPAWAITIHKSQGLTFSNAVIDAGNSFAPGQLYVALSRCRSLSGMRLESRLTESAVIIDGNVNSFIESSRRTLPDEQRLEQMRDQYFRTMLGEVFNFHPLRILLSEFSHCVQEYLAPIYPELFAQYKDAERRMIEKIDNVGSRFISLYTSERIDIENPLVRKALNDKVAGGCLYFLEQLAPICKLLNETDTELDNATYQRRLNNAMEALRVEMAMKKAVLKGLCHEEFSPAVYMRLKAMAVIDSDNNSLHPSLRGKKKSARPKGYSERETLRLFREGKSIENIAEERKLTLPTICVHLAKMIRAGELTAADVMPDKALEILHCAQAKLQMENERVYYSSLKEKIGENPEVPAHYISLFSELLRED